MTMRFTHERAMRKAITSACLAVDVLCYARTMITKVLGAVTAASPRLKRQMWRGWYEFLAGGFAQQEWSFMNYGFESLPGKPRKWNRVAAAPFGSGRGGPLFDSVVSPGRCQCSFEGGACPGSRVGQRRWVVVHRTLFGTRFCARY